MTLILSQVVINDDEQSVKKPFIETKTGDQQSQSPVNLFT